MAPRNNYIMIIKTDLPGLQIHSQPVTQSQTHKVNPERSLSETERSRRQKVLKI